MSLSHKDFNDYRMADLTTAYGVLMLSSDSSAEAVKSKLQVSLFKSIVRTKSIIESSSI